MSNDLSFGPFRLDLDRRALLRDGSPIALGGRALDLLCALAAAGGQVVTKDALMEQVWPGLAVEENNIQVQISALRRILREAGCKPDYHHHGSRPWLSLRRCKRPEACLTRQPTGTLGSPDWPRSRVGRSGDAHVRPSPCDAGGSRRQWQDAPCPAIGSRPAKALPWGRLVGRAGSAGQTGAPGRDSRGPVRRISARRPAGSEGHRGFPRGAAAPSDPGQLRASYFGCGRVHRSSVGGMPQHKSAHDESRGAGDTGRACLRDAAAECAAPGQVDTGAGAGTQRRRAVRHSRVVDGRLVHVDRRHRGGGRRHMPQVGRHAAGDRTRGRSPEAAEPG